MSPHEPVLASILTAAETGLVVTGALLAVRPGVSRFVRLAPLATLTAWLVCGLMRFLVSRLSSILVLPVGYGGCFVGSRLLITHLGLAWTHAACAFAFWSSLLFVACRYLHTVH